MAEAIFFQTWIQSHDDHHGLPWPSMAGAIASAPLHVLVTAPTGPCLKEEPVVDGVYLDMGSAMTAISMCS